MQTYKLFSAETYNCAAYGQAAYNECPTTGNNGGLSYTGEIMFAPLALGGAILIASAILLIKRLRRRTSNN